MRNYNINYDADNSLLKPLFNSKEKNKLRDEFNSIKLDLDKRIKDLEEKSEELKDIKSHITAIKATSQLQGHKNPLADAKNFRF